MKEGKCLPGFHVSGIPLYSGASFGIFCHLCRIGRFQEECAEGLAEREHLLQDLEACRKQCTLLQEQLQEGEDRLQNSEQELS